MEPCRIKLCGLRTPADVATALALRVDAVGFVLSDSPRRVTPAEAKALRGPIPPTVTVHAVTGPETPATLRAWYAASGADLLQVHGPEQEPAYWTALADLPVLRGFRLRDETTLAAIHASGLPRFLVDAYVPGLAGGTGVACDWALARKAGALGRMILAGGLTPANVAEAITTARPWMVDVSGGIESTKGIKDHDRMRAFVAAVREAGHREGSAQASGAREE